MPTPSRRDNAARHSTIRRSSLSKSEWCAAHNLSLSFFDKMKKEGWAPREMLIGNKINISAQADAEWIAAREAAAKAITEKQDENA
jgi:hypothetical protein